MKRKSGAQYLDGLKTSLNLIDAFKKNRFGIREYMLSGNMSFPLPIGHYSIKNVTFKSESFPPLLPKGDYRMEEMYYANDIKAMRGNLYVAIKYPPLYSGVQ